MQYETDLAETCRQHNVGLLAYSPLAGGSLSNKYNDGSAKEGSRFNLFPGYMGRYNESLVRHALPERVGGEVTVRGARCDAPRIKYTAVTMRRGVTLPRS